MRTFGWILLVGGLFWAFGGLYNVGSSFMGAVNAPTEALREQASMRTAVGLVLNGVVFIFPGLVIAGIGGLLARRDRGRATRIAAKTLLLVAAMGLAGCASGSFTAAPPATSDPATAATIVVVRPWNFVGGGATVTVTLDGGEVAELGTDEHLTARVRDGERLIGIKSLDPNVCCFVRIHPTQTIQAEAGKSYYFTVRPGRIDRASEADGRELMAKTKAIGE